MVCQVKSLVPVIGDTGFALAPDQTAAQVSYTGFGSTTVDMALSNLFLDKLQDVGLTTTYNVGSVSITPQVLKLQVLGFVVGAGSASISTATTTTVGLMSPTDKVKLDALTGTTNLSYTPSPTNGVVSSDTGTDATLPPADTTNAGLMSPADKVKLDALTGTTNLSYTPSPTSGIVSSDTGADATIPVADTTNAGLMSPADKVDISLTKPYIQSRGLNLVTNYTGLLGDNTNFAPLVYDPTVSPNMSASFRSDGYSAGTALGELIPVDPNSIYKIEAYINQSPTTGDFSAYPNADRTTNFLYVASIDVDGLSISSFHHMFRTTGGVSSKTVLTAPLAVGDTVVSVQNASGWNQTAPTQPSYFASASIFEYKDSNGKLYDDYTRISDNANWSFDSAVGVDTLNNTITFTSGMPASMANPDDVAGTWPIGTRIANLMAGGTFKYAVNPGLFIPGTGGWYRYSARLGGIDKSGANNVYNFAPGTASIKLGWLSANNNIAGGLAPTKLDIPTLKMYIAGYSMKQDDTAKLAPNADGSAEVHTLQTSPGGTYTFAPQVPIAGEAV